MGIVFKTLTHFSKSLCIVSFFSFLKESRSHETACTHECLSLSCYFMQFEQYTKIYATCWKHFKIVLLQQLTVSTVHALLFFIIIIIMIIIVNDDDYNNNNNQQVLLRWSWIVVDTLQRYPPLSGTPRWLIMLLC